MDEKEQWGKPVAYYPIYNKITGSTCAGYLLAQIVYWNKVKNGGEFYKTNEEFCEELCLKINEFKAAKKILLDLGIIKVVKRGVPSTSYYQLVENELTSRLNSSQLSGLESANCVVESKPTNSETTTQNSQRLQQIYDTADQEEEIPPTEKAGVGELPLFLGKTPVARLFSVYSLRFADMYGFKPTSINWAQMNRVYKPLLDAHSEYQVASLILEQFDWYGADGEDQFANKKLASRCFPMEWVPNSANAYRAYIQNTLGIAFEDPEEIKKWVIDIIKPLWLAEKAYVNNG